MVKRIVSLLTLLALFLWGGPVDKIVRLEAMLYAKILFLDYDIQKKLLGGKVLIAVVYDTPEHRKLANDFAAVIDGKTIMRTLFHVVVLPVDRLSGKPPTAYAAFLGPPSLKKLAQTAVAQHRMMFLFDASHIRYGMVTMQIGARVTPLLNPHLIHKAQIELRPIIFKVSKVWHENGS